MAEINVTPFTDVLLVLLIVFMVLAAVIVPPGFERGLPCHCGGHAALRLQPPLPVVIDAAGRTFIAGHRTSDRAIYDDLRVAIAARTRHAIALEAEPGTPYGAVLRVLDAAKAAGDADVTFVTY